MPPNRRKSYGLLLIFCSGERGPGDGGSLQAAHQNCIICWNYLYLSQGLEEIEDAASRESFLDAVAHGSAISWQHINLPGEYDFSDEKLRDSIGIRPPKLTP